MSCTKDSLPCQSVYISFTNSGRPTSVKRLCAFTGIVYCIVIVLICPVSRRVAVSAGARTAKMTMGPCGRGDWRCVVVAAAAVLLLFSAPAFGQEVFVNPFFFFLVNLI